MAADAGITVFGEDVSRGEGWCYKKILREAPLDAKSPPNGSVAIVHCMINEFITQYTSRLILTMALSSI